MQPLSPTNRDRKSLPAIRSRRKAIQLAGTAIAKIHEQAGAPALGLGRERGD